MTDGPRYSGAVRLIQLMTALQATTVGMTIEQIMQRFSIGRRTAERRLGAVRQALPDELEERIFDGRKHWRLRGSIVGGLVRPDATELAALDSAIELTEREGRPDQAKLLRSLADKTRALASPEGSAALETDVGALLEGQGLAMRPGPHPIIPLDVVDVLRQALLACREVNIDYVSRVRPGQAQRTVRPYGFLFGGRHYLVAHDVDAHGVRMFSLAEIRNAEMTEAYFEKPPDFDLRAHAQRSFGVWQEEPYDVVWRFHGAAVRDARDHVFHPTQRTEEQPDGSLIVRFRAGGLWEMAWHLFTWRDQVEILQPAELKETLVAFLEAALAAHRAV